LYLCLAWLVEQAGQSLAEREIALFSYGSGCCAEFFTGRFVRGAATAGAHIGAASLLEARKELSVDNYEAFARDGRQGGTPPSDETASVTWLGCATTSASTNAVSRRLAPLPRQDGARSHEAR